MKSTEDIKAFEQEYDSMALLKILAQGTKEIESGELKPAEEAFYDLELKIKRTE
jgi:hypothetical protein